MRAVTYAAMFAVRHHALDHSWGATACRVRGPLKTHGQ